MKISDTTAQDRVDTPPRVRSQEPLLSWERIGLGAILLLSAVLNFYSLDENGYGNTYYAAAVKSMLMSWHNFFFVSFDPGGFVTVDKPPLGFWIQTASSKLFGFNGWSLMFPQALAGVISVSVLYFLLKRHFGTIAGLVAALALALMPISVVATHNNTIDNQLVLAVLMGALAVTIATEKGSLRWLLACALCVGLAFNIKMLEAYLVVPAFGLMYLLGAPILWRKRILHLLLALMVMLVISFAWIVTVDSIPASQRPYVGSSQTNSEMELALGYNGIERLLGGIFGGRGRGAVQTPRTDQAGTEQGQQFSANGFFGGETGNPGPLRLINAELGGQVSWLLPLAIVGLLVAGWQTVRARRRSAPVEAEVVEQEGQIAQKKRWYEFTLSGQQQTLVMWGMWLLTVGIFFSVAEFFHTYYLVTFAPAVAALAGIGIVALWQEYVNSEQRGWTAWLLPATLLLTAGVQAYILSSYPDWSSWLTPLVLVLCIGAALVLIIARLMPALHLRIALEPAVIVAMVALLIAPLIWSVTSVAQPLNSTLPSAGPSRADSGPFGNFGGRGGRRGGSPFDTGNNSKLEQYLLANQGSTTYLLAVSSASQAAPYILDTGKPVMALGGFLGSDPILTNQQLADLVKNGTVRYFLLPSFNLDQLPAQFRETIKEGINSGEAGGFGGMNLGITSWVTAHCSTVASNLWQASTQNQSPFPGGGQGGQGGFPGGEGGFPGGGQGGFPGGGESGFPGGGQGGFPGGGFPGGGGLGQQLYDCSSAH